MASEQDQQQPSLAGQVARQAARQAAEQVAKQVAQQALTKAAAVVGAKAGVILAIVVAIIIAIVLVIVLIVAVGGGPIQHSAAVWPVPVATDTAGRYPASGWTISSPFGWRADPFGGGPAFHDGLDLANPTGRCPFGYHCGAPSIFDGQVLYVGWDQSVASDPAKDGGGMLAIISNGQDDHQVLYAHLEPYRLYVQLQGRIDDPYGRYDAYGSYQPIGSGELQPDLANGGIAMACRNDMPNFIPTRSGGGTVVFLYDRPADCTTTVVWGQRGDGWAGWTPDSPGAHAEDPQRADLRWQTPIEPGKRAKDVALRFRAHLVPPPPPPTEVPTDTVDLPPDPGDGGGEPVPPPPAVAGGGVPPGQGGLARSTRWSGTPTVVPTLVRTGKPQSCVQQAGGWVRCTWAFADIPTERERFAAAPDPWLVAAQAITPTQELHDHADDADVGPTVPPAQLLPASPTRGTTPTPTVTPTPTPGPPRAAVALLGQGGPLAQPPTMTGTGAVRLTGSASSLNVAPGQDSVVAFTLENTGGAARTVTLRMAFDPQLRLLAGFAPAGGQCSFVGQERHCTVPLAARASVTLATQVLVQGNTPFNTLLRVTAAAADDLQRQADAEVLIRVAAPATATPTTPPGATPTPDTIATPEPGPGGGGPPPGTGPTPVGGGGPGSGPGSGLDCAPRPLVRLPNVSAPNPRLVEPAAASFAQVRAEIIARTGIDALAVLADVLRQPSFTTSKPGVLNTSWHKAGRAVDLNQGGPFVRVAEGAMFRLYVHNVDITAIFESHGWRRIPVQGTTLEWWHYEWHPDGIAWTSAMLQVWDTPTLTAAFPSIDWDAIGCTGGSNSGTTDPTINPQDDAMCVLGSPSYSSTVETFAGCGPPIRAGDQVYQLDSIVGFVGLTGRTTGPHLHLGLKVRSYQGVYPAVDICTPEWLQGNAYPPPETNCWTDTVDPLSFLPRAPGNAAVTGSDGRHDPGLRASAAGNATPTPIIPEGAPYQLPPPNYPDSLVFTPVPDATPVGQYWSPYADGGQYGGGGVGEWFCSVWSGWPWCQ